MLSTPNNWFPKLNSPCWSMECFPHWKRTRKDSLSLHDLELWLVWKGRGWMKTGKHTLPLLPGFCALMRPGGIYDAEQDEKNPLGITFIHFDLFSTKTKRKIPNIAHHLLKWREFYQIRDLEYLNATMKRIERLSTTAPATGELLLKAVLVDVVASPMIPSEKIDSYHSNKIRISELCSNLRTIAISRMPTVSEMARKSGYSPAHFSRTFHLVMGQSPQDYLIDIRLERARQMLLETNKPVQEISDTLGYRDVFFFSRQFKKKIGVPPSHFRAPRGSE